MHLLPVYCTTQDVIEADTETIYYSFHSKREYTLEVHLEMASQLTMRGV